MFVEKKLQKVLAFSRVVWYTVATLVAEMCPYWFVIRPARAACITPRVECCYHLTRGYFFTLPPVLQRCTGGIERARGCRALWKCCDGEVWAAHAINSLGGFSVVSRVPMTDENIIGEDADAICVGGHSRAGAALLFV